ncbi:MAG: hypothetical protein ACYSUT_06705 [Planctomycetota bacterium]|jgi:hypothetical protein
MIKQIFSRLGRKKNTPGGADNNFLLKDMPPIGDKTSGQTDPSVVPLHSTPRPIIPKKKDSAEVLQDAFDKLVGKLEGINDNLSAQIKQNEKLVEKMDALPELLTPLPKAVQEQQAAFAQVAEQLKDKVTRDEKVADELIGIHEKVAVSAEVDAKMCDNFEQFSGTLSKLDIDMVHQTEWIQHMGQTLAANERYVKDAMAKQQTRFYWICGISLAVSLLAVAGLVVGILLMRG